MIAALDVRGFGDSDCPTDVSAYEMQHLTRRPQSLGTLSKSAKISASGSAVAPSISDNTPEP